MQPRIPAKLSRIPPREVGPSDTSGSAGTQTCQRTRRESGLKKKSVETQLNNTVIYIFLKELRLHKCITAKRCCDRGLRIIAGGVSAAVVHARFLYISTYLCATCLDRAEASLSLVTHVFLLKIPASQDSQTHRHIFRRPAKLNAGEIKCLLGTVCFSPIVQSLTSVR